MELDRRSVLEIGGLVAVGGLVAACSSSASATGGSATSAAGGSGGSASAAGSGKAPGAITLAKTGDIPVGGGVIVADPAVVVTQPAAGQFRAFSSICPHQGCAVGEVKDNTIRCPCHGSKFSAEDGSVLNGPATSALAAATVTVVGENVVLSG